MIKRGNARGLSTIVATLIIILLVLVATGIVWVVVRTVINQNVEKISLGTLTINLEIVSVKKTPTDLNIKVRRNQGEGDLKGITFLVFDGENTHVFEKTNITLNQFETKTFVVDYTGKVVSVSIAPMFATSSGKLITEGIADKYYIDAEDEESSYPNCIPNCNGIECGDNGCGGICGTCSGSTPDCVQGNCILSTEPCESDCTCAANTCLGRTCSDGCSGSCIGQLAPNCELTMCGEAPNGCGTCGTCEAGYHCDGETCKQDCLISDCETRECGTLPGRSDCGETFCGLCTGIGETCNESSGACEVCIPNCAGRGCGLDPVCQTSCGSCNLTATCNVSIGLCIQCQPNCDLRNCGPVPNGCGESCGLCDTLAGEYCSINGFCVVDKSINNGTVATVWPYPNGRVYFDSPDLPVSGENYVGYFVKLESEYDCLTIFEFVTPKIPEIYNWTYMKVSLTATDIESGDKYEIWTNQTNCRAS
ncbi:MAG: hypothetical protein ABIE36_02305 [Candidatus Diapherotrites archaeon]